MWHDGPSRRTLICTSIVLCVLIGSSLLFILVTPPTGTATNDTAPADCTPGTTPHLTATFTVTPHTHSSAHAEPRRYRGQLTYHVPPNTSNFTLTVTRTPANATVIPSTGFTQTAPTEYRWTGNTTTPTLAITFTADHPTGREPVRGPSWAVATKPGITHTVSQAGTRYCGGLNSALVNTSVTTPGGWNVSTSPRKLLLTQSGQTTVTRTLTNGSQLRVIVPSAPLHPNTQTRLGDLLDRLHRTSQRLTVGCHRNITWFVLPYSNQNGGITYFHDGTATVWVAGQSLARTDAELWVHEYVHTRQCFQLTQEMEWITEASASYYEEIYPYKTMQNRAHFRLPSSFTSPVHNESTLTQPATWTTEELPYDKGAKVLMYLEYQLETNGTTDASIRTLFTWLNTRSKRVTYQMFRSWVVARTTPAVGDWLDTHVAGNNTIRITHQHTQVIDSDQYTRPPTPTPTENETTTCTVKLCR